MNGYKSQVTVLINNGVTPTFQNYGIYRLPLKITYEISSDLTIQYDTNLILNYSKSILNFVEGNSSFSYSTPFKERDIKIGLEDDNLSRGLSLSSYRAILTESTLSTKNLTLKSNYVLKNISLIRTEDNIFGYKIIFESDGAEEVCFIYERISGEFNDDASLLSVRKESYIGNSTKIEIVDDTITVNDVNTFDFVMINTSNSNSIAKVTDELGNVIFASVLEQSYQRLVHFTASGTYNLLIIAPNGNTKNYTIIVNGENLEKPLAKITVGSDSDKVELIEKFEEVDGDFDFVGDFNIENDENLQFIGYLGESTISQTKVINGKTFLELSLVSSVIDRFYADEEGKTKLVEDVNSLEAFENELEQKYVVFYVHVKTAICKNIAIPCYMYFLDK